MFKKIKKIIFIFSIMFVIGGFCLPSFAYAGEILDINFFGHNTLFSEANFVPGKSVSRLVEITNKTDENQPIAVKAEKTFDDGRNLGTQMEISIFENSNELYKNSLADFFNAGEVYLSDLAQEATTQYNFIINFDEITGNYYQGAKFNFNIIIGSQAGESIGGENSSAGGGYQYRELIISNKGIIISNTSVVISWLTNNSATSRVIYDTESHPDISQSIPPNYGYKFSNTEDTNKVKGHSMEISGLNPSTQYYFRPLSKASPEKYGNELSFTTTKNKDEVIVLGEAGEPKLDVENIIKEKTVNLGQTGIECEIIIRNSGNLPAFNVNLANTLSEGIVYNATNNRIKKWSIGDISEGEFTSISYMIDIKDGIEEGRYTNFAEISASNHSIVESEASILVQKVKVLGMEFIKSGFSPKEFFLLLGILMILIVLVLFARKKLF